MSVRLPACRALLGGLVLLTPSLVLGQTSAQAYVFAAPGGTIVDGGSAALMQVGGGGELILGDAVGISAEVGYLAPFAELGDGIGVFSLNGSYHFFPHQLGRRVRPFVTGGYTIAFREGTWNLWNLGGGADYWLNGRVGLRFEFRDQFDVEGGESLHHLAGRFGVVFR